MSEEVSDRLEAIEKVLIDYLIENVDSVSGGPERVNAFIQCMFHVSPPVEPADEPADEPLERWFEPNEVQKTKLGDDVLIETGSAADIYVTGLELELEQAYKRIEKGSKNSADMLIAAYSVIDEFRTEVLRLTQIITQQKTEIRRLKPSESRVYHDW